MKKQTVIANMILLLSPILAILLVLLSIRFGTKSMSTHTVMEALIHFDSSQIDHQIIWTSRLPRAVGAILMGACLAVSGAVMQGMTRNYLASPSIMGVTDGSVFVITLCMIFLPGSGSMQMILSSLLGSLVGAFIVFSLAWLLPEGLTPIRMAIIGTIIGTFLGGVSQALATYFQVSQNISFWYNARLHQMDPDVIKLAIPFAVAGIILALCLAKSLTILSFGEEISTSLGENTKLVKGLALIVVVILTGISVALAGKIAFVGLIIPHITRFLVGQDYKWIIPCAAVIGGLFLVFCDLISRFINFPFETPVGVVTAIFGVPYFLYLIRTRGGSRSV